MAYTRLQDNNILWTPEYSVGSNSITVVKLIWSPEKPRQTDQHNPCTMLPLVQQTDRITFDSLKHLLSGVEYVASHPYYCMCASTP